MVWNPFSGISGLLSSPTEEEGAQIDPRYGIPRADVRQAQMGLLGNIGATLLAAGQRISPADRARLLAQVGPQTAQFSTDIYNAAQRRYQQGMLQEAQAKRKFEQEQADREEALKAKAPALRAEALTRAAAMAAPTYEATEYAENGTPTKWSEVARAPSNSAQNQMATLISGGFSAPEAKGILEAGKPSGNYEIVKTTNGYYRINKDTGETSQLVAPDGGLLTAPPPEPNIKHSVDANGGITFTNLDTGESLYVPPGENPNPEKWKLFTSGGRGRAPSLPPVAGQPEREPPQDQRNRFDTLTVTADQIRYASKPFVGAVGTLLGGFEGTVGQLANLAGRPGELNPEVSAGARYVNSVANAVRQVYAGPGRDGIQEQKWAQDVLNIPDSAVKRFFSNPASTEASIMAAAKYAEDGIARIDANLKTRNLSQSVYSTLQKERIDLQNLLAAINNVPGTGRSAGDVDAIMGQALNPNPKAM